MPYDWNHNGKSDWEDQMMEDDFDDFVLKEVMKHNSVSPPVKKTQTSSSTKIRASIVPGSDSRNKVPTEYRHGRAYRHAWIKANIPHMVILGIAFLCFAFFVGKFTGMLISVLLTMPFAMFVCHYYAWDVPDMKELVRISVAQSKTHGRESEDGRINMSERRGRKPSMLTGIAVLLVFALLAVAAGSYMRYQQLQSLYDQALSYCESGDYSLANDRLYSISKMSDTGFKDSSALSDYCYAMIFYRDGNLERASYWIPDSSRFHYQSEEWMGEYEAFSARLTREFKAYQLRKEKEEQEEFENRIVNGVPFVGMPESRIGDTTLGRPDPKIRHNTEIMKGKAYRANLYDFRVNGHRIYSARCINGKVTQVWDERDKDTSKPYVPITYSYTPKEEKTKRRSDLYDVYDYDDPEDFYYDHEDEFEDYEDAEDYFEEAWDE